MDEQQSGNAQVEPNWRVVCLCAVNDGVPFRSLCVALVVGTVLNLINQGDAILAGVHVNWLKVLLTYCVPYAVCTYGAVSSKLKSQGPGTHQGLEAAARARNVGRA